MSGRLEARNLSKRFGTFYAVDGVSLTFEPGLIHAVVGENGAGKSTLLKLLFGLHQPTSGEIQINGQVVRWRSPMDAIGHGLGMVQQHFQLVDALSVINNITLGAEICGPFGHLDRRRAIERIESLLPHRSLILPWHEPVRNLSVGQKQKVEILKLLYRQAHILFLDEPTAVLTPSEIEEFFAVLRRLKEAGNTVVLITHKIGEVLELCDTFAVIRSGKLVTQGLVRESSAESIVRSMIGKPLADSPVDRLPPQQESALICRGLSELGSDRDRMRGVSLDVRMGEIVGVAGVEGSGQTHLVESIMGLRAFQGEIEILGAKLAPLQTQAVRSLGTGLIPEDRQSEGLWLDESCLSNMIVGLEERFIQHHIFVRQQIKTETSQWARDFDLRAASLDLPAAVLSGGNQQKLVFAREVSGRHPRLLICHHPTRGVDLGAMSLIHRRILGLRNEGVGIFLLSSDLDELMQLCDRIFVLFEGKVAAELSRGNFDRMKIGAAMTGLSYA